MAGDGADALQVPPAIPAVDQEGQVGLARPRQPIFLCHLQHLQLVAVNAANHIKPSVQHARRGQVGVVRHRRERGPPGPSVGLG